MRGALAAALTVAAYYLSGLATLLLGIPPGYATPLFPAAGVALACVLVFGPRVLPAVAIGSFVLNTTLGAQHAPVDLPALLLPGCMAVGATLQAWAGAALIQRLVRQPLTLSEPRDLAKFFVACAVSCVIAAGIGVLALWQGHVLPVSALPFSAFTWWVGNLLGTLIATPIVLTLIGQPRDAWVPRRKAVGLTLTLVTLLLALGIMQVMRWTDERVRAAFERDASSASFALASRLREPLQALEAMRGVFLASDDVTRAEMHLAAAAWLKSGTLQAIAWSERVRRADVPAFEAMTRAEGLANFHVFDRKDAGAAATPPGEDPVVLRYIEPMQGNAAALGLNALSLAATRAAIERTRLDGEAAATGGFRLTQQAPGESELGVVVYQAIYKKATEEAPEGKPALEGTVSVTLRMQTLLRGLQGQFAPYLAVCVIDMDAVAPTVPLAASSPAPEPATAPAPASGQRLAGPPGCETVQGALAHVRKVDYGGRHWELRVSAQPTDLPDARTGDAWLFSLVGLMSAAVLGAFLLLVTGRTRRIETAVQERTAALEGEVREREVAEAALRESEQRFRNILNSVPIGVVYSDLRGKVIQANPGFCALTGYSEDELMRLGPLDYTHPDDIAQDAELNAQLVRGHIPMYRLDKRYVAKGGRIVRVRATVSMLRDAHGQGRRIVAVVEDITEHLRLEEAEHAREAAEASNRAKSEFLSRMSHELRTPLNAMLGFAQLLDLDQRHPLADPQRPWIAQIQQAGWHLLEMINDVLDLSRIESGNLRLQTETLNLLEVLAASVSMVEGEAQRRRIDISQDLEPGSLTVVGDATRIKQILTNLLSNAVKYNADAGRIHILSRLRDGDMVEITVIDTGLGMTPQQMAELFQPFNRLGRERSGQEGTGIGLVISQRLAELMGGSLHARSVTGEGSSFILSLPLATDIDTVRSDLDRLVPATPEYHRRIVHYVEDNETNVEVMRGILAQRPQVKLEVSVTGLDGLAAMRMNRPDLILLDMHLPDISGMELLRHLKADPSTAAIPIVVVSADALAQQIAAAFEAGATHYLTKPVSVSELLAVLDELLDQMQTRFGQSFLSGL
ncbi:hypothetical protein BH11PSE8_BH11PSE8_35730 [soil metagenome]